jgi:hypothetical protein
MISLDPYSPAVDADPFPLFRSPIKPGLAIH